MTLELWDPAEHAWAQRRPRNMRPPIPAAGDAVFYRHRHWGEVTRARVVDAQDLDDRDDEYLWHVVCDASRAPIIDGAGRRVLKRAPDPWVSLHLATDWGHLLTREARVRGSAGWLPLDWKRRLYPQIVDGRWTFARQMEANR
jgi:hypothetical protein